MAIEKGISFGKEELGEELGEEMGEESEETSMDDIIAGIESTIEEFDDGSIEITLGEDEDEDELADVPFGANLAEYMEEDELAAIADDLLEEVAADVTSRQEWADTFVKGLDCLGLKYEQRSEPWEDACGVYSTVLAEAAIRFQAEAMTETFPAQGPVKTKILGESTREKEDAAERVRVDMNYELTEVMTEYRPEHERMLYSLGLAGSAFKKVYFDPALNRQTALYIPAEDVIVPYGASNIEAAERVTHVMRKTENEMLRLMQAGFYIECDLPDPEPFSTDISEKKAEEDGFSIDNDNRYALYEVHLTCRLEGFDEEDSIPRPYVITIEKTSNKILAIRRNWVEDDAQFKKRQHFVHYVYVPGFGFYGLGLIHIIGGYAKAGTSLIRQLVDAGTLSNLPGGLKTRGLRIKGDDTPIGPGEWKDVDVPGGSIRENIMPLPYKEPSQTLYLLLEKITEEGRRLGAVSDLNVSDMSANAPVGTTLALLERSLKPMAAVQARVHYAMKQEFKILRKIIAEYAPEEYSYQPDRAEPRARRADYEMVEVIPVSDPNNSTLAQRVVQYQTALQMAQGAPEIYDMPYLHRQMIEVIGIKNAEKIVPLADDIKPQNPVSENMSLVMGTPVRAFMYQDHQSHLASHQAFLQDPMIAQTIGQNPQAQQINAAIQTHIAEHLAYLYRSQIEEKLGVSLPDPSMEMPEEMEVQLSKLLADAGTQLAQTHQQEAAQAQAQEQQQDPMYQLQVKDAETKDKEVQRKAIKDKADILLREKELNIDEKAVELKAITEAARLDATTQQADKKSDIDAAKAVLGSITKNNNNSGMR